MDYNKINTVSDTRNIALHKATSSRGMSRAATIHTRLQYWRMADALTTRLLQLWADAGSNSPGWKRECGEYVLQSVQGRTARYVKREAYNPLEYRYEPETDLGRVKREVREFGEIEGIVARLEAIALTA